jgi:hypothetical protein
MYFYLEGIRCRKSSYFLSAEKFRAKTGRTMMASCDGKGISEFCRRGGVKAGQNLAAVVLPVLQRGLCGKETSLLT